MDKKKQTSKHKKWEAIGQLQSRAYEIGHFKVIESIESRAYSRIVCTKTYFAKCM